MAINGITLACNYEKPSAITGKKHMDGSSGYTQKQERNQEFSMAEKSLSSRQLQERMEQELQKSLNRRLSLTEREQESVEEADKNSREQDTETTIVVKPDGSRVLMVTVNIGGMETVMSLEISKPTELPNDTRSRETRENLAEPPRQEALAGEESVHTCLPQSDMPQANFQ